MKIIQSRLEGVPGNIVDPDAVQFASRKVAAVSGDARRALDICRRAVEIAETESLAQDNTPDTPSKKYKDKVVDKRATQKKSGRVTISTVKQAINEATSSPLQQSLRYLPLSSKLFLAALLGRMTKTGIAECVLGDIIEESKRLGPMADENHIQDFLLMVENLPEKDSMSTRGKVAPSRVFAMGSAAMELMEAGVVSIEQRRGERIGKIRLNVGEDEIKVALKGDSEVRGLGFAS
jgi:origin recognition complex subunit 1